MPSRADQEFINRIGTAEVDLISDLQQQKVKMAQRGIFKILNRKDGKGIVTNAKDDEEIKVTKVLEFIPATKPQDAKEGVTIRFMHNPGDGSVYWLQGTLEKG